MRTDTCSTIQYRQYLDIVALPAGLLREVLYLRVCVGPHGDGDHADVPLQEHLRHLGHADAEIWHARVFTLLLTIRNQENIASISLVQHTDVVCRHLQATADASLPSYHVQNVIQFVHK